MAIETKKKSIKFLSSTPVNLRKRTNQPKHNTAYDIHTFFAAGATQKNYGAYAGPFCSIKKKKSATK